MNSIVYVTKEIQIDCAHFLSDYIGKCSTMHGHRYKIEVTMKGLVDRSTKMVIDFSEMKSIMEKLIINRFDHKCLNDVEIHDENISKELKDEFSKNPTAELMSIIIFNSLSKILHRHQAELHTVKVWETPTSFAEYKGEMNTKGDVDKAESNLTQFIRNPLIVHVEGRGDNKTHDKFESIKVVNY